MTTTAADLFKRTLDKTNMWLKELAELLPSSDRHGAYVALRATLHALRDRLTVEEVAQLGAQLPMLVRGFYYEGWDPTGKPIAIRHLDDFLALVATKLSGASELDPERTARAVFTLLSRRVTAGEIEDVKHILPRDIRSLWP